MCILTVCWKNDDEENLPAPAQSDTKNLEGSEPLLSPPSREQGPPLFFSSSDSDSDEDEVVIGADGFPLPSMEELQRDEDEDQNLEGLIETETRGLTSVLRDGGKPPPPVQDQSGGQKPATLESLASEAADEVAKLRAQHVASRRSEEDITTEMALDVQYMLRQFGIPYITGPMEAEAQCAALVDLGLCDGIITDDSDVFLFGGKRVLKNMFNDSKTVQVFTLHDLERGVGLDRTRLIELAYLLGSDYTPGLEGVGIVFAMEILSVFPQEDGLQCFRQWWIKVQKGAGPEVDEAVLPNNASPEEKATLRKRLKRIKRTLINRVHLSLADDWPQREVQDAYLHPHVDLGEEPFAWGVPDLEQVRRCLAHFLGWGPAKVDQYVQPVIQQVVARSRNPVQQHLLTHYAGFQGPAFQAPRNAASFGSGRLQQVVQGFRAARTTQQAGTSGEATPDQGSEASLHPEVLHPDPDTETMSVSRGRSRGQGRGTRRGRGRGRGRGQNRRTSEVPRQASDSHLTDEEFSQQPTAPHGQGHRGTTSVSHRRGSGAANGPGPHARAVRADNRTKRLRIARDLSLDDLSPLSSHPGSPDTTLTTRAQTPGSPSKQI